MRVQTGRGTDRALLLNDPVPEDGAEGMEHTASAPDFQAALPIGWEPCPCGTQKTVSRPVSFKLISPLK